MKTIVALGLAILSLMLIVVLLRAHPSSRPMPEGNLAAAESKPISRAADHGGADHTPPATQQAQPIHAILLAAMEAETDSDRRDDALDHASESVSDAELTTTLDAVWRNANPGAAALSLLLVRRWAESDPVAAAAWTSQLPENSARRAAQEQVAIAWAATDLAAATGWVQALPESDSQQAATIALAYEAARTEPVAALELTSTLPPTLARDNLLIHAISQWAGIDSTPAAKWAMQVADPILRERLVAAVAVTVSEHDGAAAATLAANALGAGVEQDRATVSIVQRWVQHSPAAAASWVGQFPEMPARNAAVQNLLALWTAQDAEAAGNWVRELPTGTLRDFGIMAYAEALADQARTSDGLPTSGGM